MRDNKGFSLVELIVVVAVVAVLVGVGARNVGVLSNYRTRECKEKLADSITEIRVEALSKSRTNTDSAASDADTYLILSRDSNKVYVTSVIPGKKIGDPAIVKGPTVISKGNRTRVFVATATSAYTELLNGQNVRIAFNRSTGALIPPLHSSSDIYSRFKLQTGSYVRELEIQTKTGKVI